MGEAVAEGHGFGKVDLGCIQDRGLDGQKRGNEGSPDDPLDCGQN